MKAIYIVIFCLVLSVSVFGQNYGFIKLDLDTDSATLVIDYKYDERIVIADMDSIGLLPGTHKLELSTPFLDPHISTVYVFQDSTDTLRIDLNNKPLTLATWSKNIAARDYTGSNVLILTDEDSEIKVNGAYFGTSYALTKLTEGQRLQILAENKLFGSKQIRVNSYPFMEVHELYLRPEKSKAHSFSIIPGASQIYKKQHLKGATLSVFTVASLILGLNEARIYNSRLDDYNLLLSQYNLQTIESEAERFGNLVEEQNSLLKRSNNKRNLFLTTSLLLYVYNIFDAFLGEPEGGYQKKRNLDFIIDELQIINTSHYSLTLSVSL